MFGKIYTKWYRNFVWYTINGTESSVSYTLNGTESLVWYTLNGT